MTAVMLQEVSRAVDTPESPEYIDTVRALCHDLRQPLAAIRLLAGASGADVQRRLDGILDQAQWLSDMVEAVIGGAADDSPEAVEVADLVEGCVVRAQNTAECHIELISDGPAVAIAAPVALGRAICCAMDNAVRAAGPGGSVVVEVSSTDREVVLRVIDDGPGLGKVPRQNSLGLTITRALVSSCGGGFELQPGIAGGMVAQIVIPAMGSAAMAS
ncbi:MAG: HAMP domain-containing sensor histidine kinase [Dermatophilaceae bacterium]